MHLIQILVPLIDNDGRRFARDRFDRMKMELTERFGGVTAFVQSPAMGLWKDAERGTTTEDEMILFEVMAENLDRNWWSAYRADLERAFRQEEILVRVMTCERV